MGIINILDKQTANLIAAGEVVERPSSAIKEMLENCADAGADKVTVEIKNGGTTYIRVTDNGKGMSRDDVPKCILRHATSKIKTGADLEAIGTFGFRGEALAAIASVSIVRIMTKTPNADMGTILECQFGEQVLLEDAGCPDGTTITVENIFQNVPARRKFLKKDSTETLSVLAACEKFALSRPEIAVTFISDNNIKLQTPGDGNLKSAVYSALGKEFANSLVDVYYEYSGITVRGFIAKPEFSRPNRNLQNFFVNNRYIRSRTMLASLEEGFRGFCPTGKFPACVLFCDINLKLVDVNVHPAKLEIKFTDERRVFDAVYFAVKNALSTTVTFFNFSKDDEPLFSTAQETKPVDIQTNEKKDTSQEIKQESHVKTTTVSVTQDSKPKYTCPPANALYTSKIFEERNTHNETKKHPDSVPELDFLKDSGFEDVEIKNPPVNTIPNTIKPEIKIVEDYAEVQQNKQITVKNEIIEQVEIIPQKELQKPIYIGEIFNTYIIVQHKKSMYIIDKHASHERIIYEKLKKPDHENSCQYLLEPLNITLTPKEAQAAAEHKEYFEKIGFEFDEFGMNTIIIRAIPSPIAHSDTKDIFTFLAGKLAEGNNKSAGEIFDRALFTAACRAAIKAGDKNTDIDNKYIINEIFNNEAVIYCPHGRPVIQEITKEKLDKFFDRL